jgi:uncharacterized protein (DUF427 family)
MKATWNNTVIAESDATIIVEGNHYFPPDAVKMEFFEESDLHTTCPWKGVASYYTINIGNQKNENAAWYYPDPKEKAHHIRNYVAFYGSVEISE